MHDDKASVTDVHGLEGRSLVTSGSTSRQT